MKELMFVGAMLLVSVSCSKENIQQKETMEALETPESIEDHIKRCEFGEECMFL